MEEELSDQSANQATSRRARRGVVPLLTVRINTDIIPTNCRSNTFLRIDSNDMKRRLKLKRELRRKHKHPYLEEEPPINRARSQVLPITNRTPPTIRYHKPKYFFTAPDGSKTELEVSSELKPFPFGGLSAAARVPGSSAELKGGSIIKRPCDDVGESSESVVDNLNPALEESDLARQVKIRFRL